MDNHLKTFMEISGLPAVAEYCLSSSPAWVWSADGARILWANAAGAAFFSVKDAAGLNTLSSLAKSPARPHIARIATSGSLERMSIERLRFYRGLRVMLLTCQGQRLRLPNGHDAALVVCSDKALSGAEAPLQGYLSLLAGRDRNVLLFDAERHLTDGLGPLGVDGQNCEIPATDDELPTFVQIDAAYYEFDAASLGDGQVVGLVGASIDLNTEEADHLDEELGSEEVVASPSSSQEAAVEAQAIADAPRSVSGWARADELYLEQKGAEADVLDEDPADEGNDTDDVPDVTSTDEKTLTDEAPLDLPASVVAGTEHPEMAPTGSADETPSFRFTPRRRPTRFAWKMDINQTFTFISDEFGDTLGPAASEIVGKSWAEVASAFDLDITGSIAKALDRRDTWSGKTVNWPVTGAALRVPVDMAALPAFDHEKEFEGYRGFGVCRTYEVIEDPTAPLKEVRVQSDAAEEAIDLPVVDDTIEQNLATAARSDAPSEADGSSVEHETVAEVVLPKENKPSDIQPEEDCVSSLEDAGSFAATEQEELVEESDPDKGDDAAVETDEAVADEDPLAHAPDAPANPAHVSNALALGTSASALMNVLAERAGVQSSDKAAGYASTPEPTELPIASNQDATATEEPDDMSDDVADVDMTAEQDTIEATPAKEEITETEDLAGISGNHPLDAREIETAVRSLAKEYRRKPSGNGTPTQTPADLFSDEASEPEEAELDTAALDAAANVEVQPTEAAIDNLDIEDGTDQLNDDDLVDNGHAEEAEASEDEAGDSEQEEAEFRCETTDHLAADLAEEFNEEFMALEEADREKTQLAASTPDEINEDQEDLSGAGFEEEPAADHDENDKVVPLAKHKASRPQPRLVPVDTSRLSKPDLAAFRKIAEALGARWEGELDDSSASDEEDLDAFEVEEPTPPAGPIDPRLLDRLPIGIAIAHDRDILYANDTLLDLLGYESLNKLSQAGGLEAVFIDDEEALPDAEIKGTVDDTLKVRLANGGIRQVDARMHSVPWNDGLGLMISFMERPNTATETIPQVATASAAATPLAVVAKTEGDSELLEKLRQTEDRVNELDAILETATDGVLVLDEHGTILKANRSAEALYSASRVDLEGAPLTDYLAPESHRSAADYLDGLSRNGVASILNDGREVLGRVSSGGLIPLFMTIGRISTQGEANKFCAVLRDITNWKRAEEELTDAKRQAENASSQKSDFLAKISHEIRTPLNAIIGFSEVMMEERFGPIGNDRYKEYLQDIRTSGSHILSLINDLLDLSKIEAGKMDMQFAAVSANDLIRECVALMQPQANRERVIIRASLPDSVPNVVADTRSLRQIALNLLSNAIKFNKSGGQVIVSTALEENGEVVLRVRDTGTGMSEKDLSAALEPFRQVHTARLGGGTGLGLPLTKALVEANRAYFHIDSTLNQGTLVEIRFPSQRVLAE